LLPKITVITPSYNQGQFIEETILSVINQDYANLEYIIIDGGSTDNTVDIIEKHESSIAYWVSEKDLGQSNAINKGLKVATGQIINWLNSDDVLLEGALSKIANYFNENPQVVIVHGRIEYFGDRNYFSKNLSAVDIKTRYLAHICMPQPAAFFKKELIDEQGFIDESLHFSMDADLYVRAGLNYSLLQVNDVLAKFRLHGKSKSISEFNKTFLTDNEIIFSRVAETLNSVYLINELKKLGLYIKAEYLYKRSGNSFDEKKLLYYFLQHRLFTLFNTNDSGGFIKLFNYLLNNFTFKTLASTKIVLYRILLLLPENLHRKLNSIK
jgi:glycosyltransferase involved in cell wall biosynthesis